MPRRSLHVLLPTGSKAEVREARRVLGGEDVDLLRRHGLGAHAGADPLRRRGGGRRPARGRGRAGRHGQGAAVRGHGRLVGVERETTQPGAGRQRRQPLRPRPGRLRAKERHLAKELLTAARGCRSRRTPEPLPDLDGDGPRAADLARGGAVPEAAAVGHDAGERHPRRRWSSSKSKQRLMWRTCGGRWGGTGRPS